MKVILASQNQHKLVELSAILSQLGFEIALESEYGLHVDVDETGTTFEENSLLKAEAVMKASGMPVLADDSGLMVDALDGAPGVYSARYGHKSSDAERIAYLLENLKDVPAERRTAKFVCVITCLWPDGRRIVARGECPGQILFAPKGTGGFGYDPLFLRVRMGKTDCSMANCPGLPTRKTPSATAEMRWRRWRRSCREFLSESTDLSISLQCHLPTGRWEALAFRRSFSPLSRQRLPYKGQQRRPPPVAETGSRCWGSGQQDASGAQRMLGAAIPALCSRLRPERLQWET